MLDMIVTLKGDPIEQLRGELAQLHVQASALAAEIDRLEAQQDDMEDPDDVLHAMASTAAARNRLRKLEAKIAEVNRRSDEAKATARAKLRGELLANFAAAAPDYLTKAKKAQSALVRVIAAREALFSAGFSDEGRSLPIPPAINGHGLLAEELLSLFELGLRSEAGKSAKAPQPTNPPPNRGNSRPGHRVSLADAPTPPPKSREPRRETAGEGEQLFMLHNGIMEHPRKGQLQAGDVVAMTPAEAIPLIRNRAGDFITASEVAALDANPA